MVMVLTQVFPEELSCFIGAKEHCSLAEARFVRYLPIPEHEQSKGGRSLSIPYSSHAPIELAATQQSTFFFFAEKPSLPRPFPVSFG